MNKIRAIGGSGIVTLVLNIVSLFVCFLVSTVSPLEQTLSKPDASYQTDYLELTPTARFILSSARFICELRNVAIWICLGAFTDYPMRTCTEAAPQIDLRRPRPWMNTADEQSRDR